MTYGYLRNQMLLQWSFSCFGKNRLYKCSFFGTTFSNLVTMSWNNLRFRENWNSTPTVNPLVHEICYVHSLENEWFDSYSSLLRGLVDLMKLQMFNHGPEWVNTRYCHYLFLSSFESMIKVLRRCKVSLQRYDRYEWRANGQRARDVSACAPTKTAQRAV